MLLRAVLASPDRPLRERLRRLLDRHEVELVPVARPAELPAALERTDPDLLVVGRALVGEPPPDWLKQLLPAPRGTDVVVLVEREDAHDRATLLAAGCAAVLNVTVADRELAGALAALLERRRQAEVRVLRSRWTAAEPCLGDFVSESRSMQEFMQVTRRVVDSDSSLLVLGETGVGKQRLARAIHHEGRRAARPFLAVNCGALPETLLESELFGHEQGAFTGATRARRGYFELAHGGTLFLDEIGDVPLHLQVKLLRVLEDRAVQRLGSERAARVDVRLMAATNRDLEREVAERRFRADLFDRLAVVTLELPPSASGGKTSPRSPRATSATSPPRSGGASGGSSPPRSTRSCATTGRATSGS
jgi:DNA-binding NtrC family response regulator